MWLLFDLEQFDGDGDLVLEGSKLGVVEDIEGVWKVIKQLVAVGTVNLHGFIKFLHF